MQFVNIRDAEANLSKYLKQLQKNHEPIVICDDGNPIGQLTEYKPTVSKKAKVPTKAKKPRKIGALKFGLLKGKIKMSDDFNDPLPDEFWGM